MKFATKTPHTLPKCFASKQAGHQLVSKRAVNWLHTRVGSRGRQLAGRWGMVL